jgi:hypothetical protein
VPEDYVKRVNVTFGTGLPSGVHGTFKHEGQMWIAMPATKHTRILTVIDRLIGIHDRIANGMIQWINRWPDDGERCAEVLEAVTRARALRDEMTIEKQKAATE